MATATKDKPATIGDILQPRPTPIDLDSHKADMARRQAELDAKREELLRCLNPQYAAQREFEKPVYQWTVRAKWLSATGGELSHFQSEQIVTAQNQSDAWSMFCDRIGQWPSRRDAKPVIKRGKQLDIGAVKAAATVGVEPDLDIPTVVIGAVSKKRKR